MLTILNSIINYFCKPAIPDNCKSIRKLEQNKCEFEEYLFNLHELYNSYKYQLGISNCSIFSFHNILIQMSLEKNVNLLFFFCYYSPINNDVWLSIFARFEDHLLNYKFNTNEYSPLSALIMSNKTLIDKRNCIQHIMKYNILPTEKDIELNSLVLYDSISFGMREIVIALLCDDCILITDIRKSIVNIWIKWLRYEYCPIV